MDFGFGTYALGLLAGAATLLSPCVLPILPILLASALSRSRWGGVLLALGLSLSFAVTGTLVASLGASIGLDAGLLRRIAAALMVLFGLVMLLPHWQVVFSRLSASAGNAGQRALGTIKGEGLLSQFLIGLLLGLAWSPCVGPTLGAATTLAAQGRDLGHVALLMIVFGLGAGLPLALLSMLSDTALGRLRGRLARTGGVVKYVLGGLFVLFGLLILSGLDRKLEALLLGILPDWLTTLTTSF